MKFQELPVKNRFSISSFPGIIFTKVPQKGGTCCTPAHNAIYADEKNNKKSKLLDGILTVTSEDSPPPVQVKKKKLPVVKKLPVESDNSKKTRTNANKYTKKTFNQNSVKGFKKRTNPSKIGGGKWGFQK